MKIVDILGSDPEIVSGAVVFKGTRVPVEALFENLAAGLSFNDILDDFPTVSEEHAKEALLLAPKCLGRNLDEAMREPEIRKMICDAIKSVNLKLLVRNNEKLLHGDQEFQKWWDRNTRKSQKCFWYLCREVKKNSIILELVIADKVRTWGVWRITSNEAHSQLWRRKCVRAPFEASVFGSGDRLEDAGDVLSRIARHVASWPGANLADGVLVDAEDFLKLVQDGSLPQAS